MSVADEVRVVVVKYKQSSGIILVGDMNASLFRDPPLHCDKYLLDLLNEMNLSLPENYPNVHTYRHGAGKSTIDYIIHSSGQLVTSVTVFDEHCNTSPHSAQLLSLSTEDKPDIKCKLRWDKVDKDRYKELVECRLSEGNVLDVEKDNINLVVEDLTDILVTTAQQCAPQRKRKKSKCKSK